MDAERFRHYLMKTYRGSVSRKPLSKAATDNAVSRCRRVERRLRIDLEKELHRLADSEVLVARVERSVERFGIQGDEYTGMASIVNAVRMYALFVGWRDR